MKDQPNVGRAEMEILRYVADHHPVSVGDVAGHIAETKGHARTTVLNVMERLRHKGFLTRKKAGGIYQYAPRLSKADLMKSLVRGFIENALGGSVSPFVAYLTEDAKLNDQELAELKRLVAELESPKKGVKS